MAIPDVSALSTNVDATHPDDPTRPSRKAHQQDHDLLHDGVRALADQSLLALDASATYPSALVLTADPASPDNAAAITARLADAGASAIVKRVYVPDGVFLTSGSHTLPAGVTLVGPGTIKRTGVSTATLLSCGAGSTVRGVTLDGSAVCQYVAQVSGDKVTFDGASVNDSDLYGIGNNGFSDLNVRGCRFLDNDLYGVIIEGAAARCRITGSLVRNLVDGHGFFWKSTGTGNTVRPTDGVCANNVVEVQGTIGIEYWGDRGSITGNVVRCGAGVIGISLAICTETTVSGNTVTASDPAASFGIEVAENSTHCTVTGNTVVGMSVGVIVSKGSRTVPSQHITISGNTIRKTTSYAVDFEFAERCTVSGNNIDDPLTTGAAIFINNGNANAHHMISGNTIVRRTNNGSGISVTGSYVTVVGNHIDHSLKPSGTGIAYGTGADFGLCADNHVIGVSTGIAISGTHTLVTGNVTLNTTSNAVGEGAAGDYNMVAVHYATTTSGGQITLVGANSRQAGPFYSRGLNRVETRATRLGVGNSLAATTPGTVVRKVEIFDAAGASLGFVPVYSSIA